VYDALVLLDDDWVSGLIVFGSIQATREPMHIFLGAMAQIERHLALRIGSSVRMRRTRAIQLGKSRHATQTK
jgi:hypothetical protein